jgi:hypothetical protein
VVKKEDAILGLSDQEEIKLAVDADHLDICKFKDPKSREFRPVWKSISEMAEQAIEDHAKTQVAPAQGQSNSE